MCFPRFTAICAMTMLAHVARADAPPVRILVRAPDGASAPLHATREQKEKGRPRID